MGQRRFRVGPGFGNFRSRHDALLTADRSAAYVQMLGNSSRNHETMLVGLARVLAPFFVSLMNIALLVLLSLWIRRKGWQSKDHLSPISGFVIPWIVGLLTVGGSFYLAVL
jgi:hypothetical protein